jgi:hypothetical protein
MKAKTFLACCEAGLALAGFENGEYLWLGTCKQWNDAERIETGNKT